MKTSERGIAAAEIGLFLPVLIFLLFILVEGTSAFRTYTQLVEASREGARIAVHEGDAVLVPAVLATVLRDIPGGTYESRTVIDEANETVSVQVTYEYHANLLTDEILEAIGNGPFLMRSETVMPLP